MEEEGNNVARILKQVLVYEYPGALEKAAAHLNETYDYIWSQTAGRVNPAVHVIRGVYEVTGDPKLKRLLTPVGYELLPASSKARPTGHFEAEIGDLDIAVAKLRTAFREVLKDNRITPKEANRLQKLIDTLRVEIADVEAIIKKAQ